MRGARFYCLSLVLMLAAVQSMAQPAIAVRVENLLDQMTLEEKVGQMTQITLEMVCVADSNGLREPLALDPKKLREVILDQGAGALFNVGTHAHTLERWNEIISEIQNVARESRLKIPVLYGIDGIHGASYTRGATLFPQSIAMASTWNPELVRKSSEITAIEIRASGIPWNFNPVLDSGRQPLWPRLWESYGEDAFLTTALGTAYIQGQEGDPNDIAAPDKVAACLKHYIGYGAPLSGKDRTPAWFPDRYLRQYILPPYKAAIAAGAHTVMVNSGDINGEPVHVSHYLLTDLLRGELGFTGVIDSDYADIVKLWQYHHIAADNKEAVRLAVMAGIDMSMVPSGTSFSRDLIALVQEGKVPMSRIDEACGRILTLKYQLGLFDNPYPDPSLRARFATPEAAALNLQAAQEAITLLKNEGALLPLHKSARVLVTGPTATRLSTLNGGWTYTWQGEREDLMPKDKLTLLKAIVAKLGADKVNYLPGSAYDHEVDIPAAVKATKKADVVIACIGEEPYCETPGNISDLTLPDAQLDLVKALVKTGKPVVLVLAEGRPRIIRPVADGVKAILLAWLPGMEGGRATADILFGDCNPSGRLPVTYPRWPNDLVLYDHAVTENTGGTNRYNPQWPFGFGLSYTTFAYSDLHLDKSTVASGEVVTASVTVTNTGTLAGKETVQLYLSDLVASLTPPNKRLKGFRKIELAPGESKNISFTLSAEEMSFIGQDGKPLLEPGEFMVSVADLKQKFTLQ
ncbi:MAG TPA: glycoside hydrolase family 3 N-terminal domain-containing protein [bacterium]|nr:glycoside hydrolase family 3 N-terminal domain-containing protein [bacterium]HPR87912.1 glycoside hydrolase family 3 N-terminal domain-containing protein [bacterium]